MDAWTELLLAGLGVAILVIIAMRSIEEEDY